MSEDYKKIAPEDVKKGQRIRIVERHPSLTITYEGAVLKTMIDLGRIDLGEEVRDYVTIIVDPEPEPGIDFDIFLLEYAPKPKVVSVQTVLVTRYDDGTEKTEVDTDGVWVPMRGNGWTEWASAPSSIHTMEQFEAHEDYLKTKVLKDKDGDYWTYRNGRWCWTNTNADGWIPSEGTAFIKGYLPMTIVENVGD